MCWFTSRIDSPLFSTIGAKVTFETVSPNTGRMTEHAKPTIGRPSKGRRHSFTVKLDLERAGKLMSILRTLNTNGIDYLAPVIETHLDSIDLDHLRNNLRRRTIAVAASSATSTYCKR